MPGPIARSAPFLAAAFLRGLTGWRRVLAAMAAGTLACLALPPADLLPVLWLAVPALVCLLEGADRPKLRFLVGWSFGFGYFAVSLYWVSFALFVDIARYWWLVPFAAPGLAAGLALFWGLAALPLALVPTDRPFARIALLVASWSIAEWLRGHVLTGFPWNLPGYAWADFPGLIQSAAAVGIYGVTLVALLVPALASTLGSPYVAPRRARFATAAGLVAMLIIAMAGHARIPSQPTPTVPGVRLRLVQPGIEQSLKWVEGRLVDNVRRHIALSTAPAAGGERPNLVIWPEAAEPFPLDRNPDLAQALGKLPAPGGLLITGTLRAVPGPDGKRSYRNSLEAIDSEGGIVAAYDKAHLVPFGEYMPLSRWLPLQAVAAGDDLAAGPGVVTVALPGFPAASPLICYEAIFPHAVADEAQRPGWLLNITNDAWFGLTAGPHQDFSIARIRTIEEGLPLVRAANNGVSGVVDPYGRIVAYLDLGKVGAVDAELPMAIDVTPYARIGDLAFWTLAGVLVLVSLVTNRR